MIYQCRICKKVQINGKWVEATAKFSVAVDVSICANCGKKVGDKDDEEYKERRKKIKAANLAAAKKEGPHWRWDKRPDEFMAPAQRVYHSRKWSERRAEHHKIYMRLYRRGLCGGLANPKRST